MRYQRQLLLTAAALSQATSGCTQPELPADHQPPDAAAPSADAAAPPDLPSSCTPTSCATVQGVVRRKAGVRPQNGGKGSLYISVMDGDPVLGGGSVRSIAVQVVPNVDLNPDTAAVPYQLLDVPLRKEPYFVVAFLDDNGTVNQDKPGPDKGDLLSLEGLAAPKLTIDKPGTLDYDITLTTYLPF